MAGDLSRDRAGLVVEFVGLPGSGKSTVSHAAAEVLRLRGHRVHEPTFRTDRLPSPAARRVRKAILASVGLAAGPAGAVSDLAAIRRSAAPAPGGWATGGLNWLYVSRTARRAARRPGIHLLDQGVLQALWSVLYATDREDAETDAWTDAWARRAAGRIPSGTVAVVLDAADDELHRRLGARTGGGSRLDAEIRQGAGAAERALSGGRAALAAVDAVASRLQAEGRLDLHRLNAGGADPSGLADRVAAIVEARLVAAPPR